MSDRHYIHVFAVCLLAGALVGLSACAKAHPSAEAQAPRAPSGSYSTQHESQPVLVGAVTHVVDGDTIDVRLSSGPIKVRLGWIDTPEWNQPWGTRAKSALRRRLDRQQVSLKAVGQDSYHRMVAIVYLGDENINGWMVQQGHAWAYRQYMEDVNYCAWEGEARTKQLGLWSLPPSETHAPWEWRARERGEARGFTDYSHETVANCIASMRHGAPTPGSTAAEPRRAEKQHSPPGECRIKGNISKNGKIYHVPGSASYASTIIDETKGERWFCTEDEARAAGWRPPRQ